MKTEITITSDWNTPMGWPNGGHLLQTMVGATMAALEPGVPLVAAATYLSSPDEGPADVDIEPLKLKGRVRTTRTSLQQGGRTAIEALLTFGDRPASQDHESHAAPDLGDPGSGTDPLVAGFPADGIFGRVEYRLPEPPGWSQGKPGGSPRVELWQRLAGGAAPEWPDLAMFCDSFAPAVMDLGLSSMTVQYTVHFHRLPVSDWIATRITTGHVVDGFHEEDVELWDVDGNFLAQSRQLAILL